MEMEKKMKYIIHPSKGILATYESLNSCVFIHVCGTKLVLPTLCLEYRFFSFRLCLVGIRMSFLCAENKYSLWN